MKSFIKEYQRVIVLTICGILLILGSYSILINVNHATYLNKKIMVSAMDGEYRNFKNNIVVLEEKTQNISDSNIKNSVRNIISIIKNGGAYQLMPGDTLGYVDLYNLNDYFIDTIINDGWISSLKQISRFNTSYNNNYMNLLINNANYINKEILNNSNFHYDMKNNDIRNTLEEEYRYILNNYNNYALFLINLCTNGDKNG